MENSKKILSFEQFINKDVTSVNEARNDEERELIKKYPKGANLINNLNNQRFDDWYKLFNKYISGDLKPGKLEELYEDAEDMVKLLSRK